MQAQRLPVSLGHALLPAGPLQPAQPPLCHQAASPVVTPAALCSVLCVLRPAPHPSVPLHAPLLFSEPKHARHLSLTCHDLPARSPPRFIPYPPTHPPTHSLRS